MVKTLGTVRINLCTAFLCIRVNFKYNT